MQTKGATPCEVAPKIQHGEQGSKRSELQTHGDLSGSASAKIGSAYPGDFSEAAVCKAQVRVGQVRMVEDVRESPFGAQLESLGEREDFAQAGRQVDGARSLHIAYARGPETANWVRGDAYGAGAPGINRIGEIVVGAGEGTLFHPGAARAIAGHAAAEPVATLRTSRGNACTRTGRVA